MVQKIKTELYNLIKQELNYNLTDNGAYADGFPRLRMRVNTHQRLDTLDMRVETISIIIDIFSDYKGEKEILEISENITNNLYKIKQKCANIMYAYQKDLKILEDHSTGALKMHGVLCYHFICTGPIVEEEEEEDG